MYMWPAIMISLLIMSKLDGVFSNMCCFYYSGGRLGSVNSRVPNRNVEPE